MRPYQTKFYNQGYSSMAHNLREGVPIDAQTLIDLLNDSHSVKTTMREATLHRDNNLEAVGSTTEEFQTGEALGYELAGQMRALVDFANGAMARGVRFT